jgi:flagellar hook-associated protein 2
MAGLIAVGGLATGLDTNKLIDQLVAVQHRPIDQLQERLARVQSTQAAFSTLGAKLATFKSAADALKTTATVLVRKASSSEEAVATAIAGEGAAAGSVALTVSQVARGSVASAASGVGSITSAVASGAGTFSFQVGSGDPQNVAVDASTTLEELVTAINGLGAGVNASSVNIGTSAAPDYRLQITSSATGASSTITILQDDTNLAVATTQAGLNAQFTIDGFTGSFERESNTFSDVLNGVTFNLKAAGSTTITVVNDAAAISTKAQALADAFNDIVNYVAGESSVTKSEDSSTVTLGSLANNSTVRRLLDQLHSTFSATVSGASTKYVNLGSLGFATQQDGTILFNAGTFQSALAADSTGVAQVFAGNGTGAGIANDLSSLITTLTQADGTLFLATQSLGHDVEDLQSQIDVGERNLTAFHDQLSARFAALEVLVSGLQAQSSFLSQAFR